jgi:hypothetical protein
MRNQLFSGFSLIALGVWLALGSAGCSREPAEDTEKQKQVAASQLPGATNVFAALDRKDYEGAITALVKVKESLTAEQQVDFAVLSGQVKTRLMEAAPTDPKASEALNVLRTLSTGR